jgi:hypothetical protein
MTQPDIYTIEARRRLAETYDAQEKSVSAKDIRDGFWRLQEVETLAATLRELNWQPPVDPDLVEARRMAVRHGYCEDGYIPIVAFVAIKRGRELERGA